MTPESNLPNPLNNTGSGSASGGSSSEVAKLNGNKIQSPSLDKRETVIYQGLPPRVPADVSPKRPTGLRLNEMVLKQGNLNTGSVSAPSSPFPSIPRTSIDSPNNRDKLYSSLDSQLHRKWTHEGSPQHSQTPPSGGSATLPSPGLGIVREFRVNTPPLSQSFEKKLSQELLVDAADPIRDACVPSVQFSIVQPSASTFRSNSPASLTAIRYSIRPQPSVIPEELLSFLSNLHEKFRLGRMGESKFQATLKELRERCIFINKQSLAGGLQEDMREIEHNFRYILEEEIANEDHWRSHPVFVKVDLLRQFLEKYLYLEKTPPLVQPQCLQRGVETIFKLMEAQPKELSNTAAMQSRQEIARFYEEEKALSQFVEGCYKVLPKLLENYNRAYSRFFAKLKEEIEHYDGKQRNDWFSHFRKRVNWEAEILQKQPIPDYDVYQSLSILQTIAPQIRSKHDNSTNILYGNPILSFRGVENAEECLNAKKIPSNTYIQQRKESFTKQIHALAEEIRTEIPITRSMLFSSNKIKSISKPRTRVILPRGKEKAILTLPEVDYSFIDPVFLELDGSGLGQLAFYYEINTTSSVPSITLDVALKFYQNNQTKSYALLYSFVRELSCHPDRYSPLFHQWIDGCYPGIKDILTIKYSAQFKELQQKDTTTKTAVGYRDYPDIELLNERFPPSMPYIPLRSCFFDNIQATSAKNLSDIKQKTIELLKTSRVREWEKCCNSIFAEVLSPNQDSESLAYNLLSLNTLHTVIESICVLNFGPLYWQGKQFKFLIDAGIHVQHNQFMEFIKKRGPEAVMNGTFEPIISKLQSGTEEFLKQNLHPPMPYFKASMEALGDCLEVLNQHSVSGEENVGSRMKKIETELVHLKQQYHDHLESLHATIKTLKEDNAKFQSELLFLVKQNHGGGNSAIVGKTTPSISPMTIPPILVTEKSGSLMISPIEESPQLSSHLQQSTPSSNTMPGPQQGM